MAKKFDLKVPTKTPLQEQEKQSKYSRYLQEELANSTHETSGEAKRSNMAFTNTNYEIIQEESQRLGISMQYMIMICFYGLSLFDFSMHLFFLI